MDVDSSESSSDDRITIRDELKSMSFDELLKLKGKIEAKCYNESVFKPGPSSKQTGSKIRSSVSKKKDLFNRTNKNRPREESSKVPVKSMFLVTNKSEVQVRDPRFDSLCGEFNEHAFAKNYDFINTIKEKDLKTVQHLYSKQKDPEEKAKIKLALERLKNQKRSLQQRQSKLLEKQSQRQSNLQLIREGKKPHFKSKGEVKALNLIDMYEKLKADGKLDKHIKKKNKELSRKSRFKEYFN